MDQSLLRTFFVGRGSTPLDPMVPTEMTPVAPLVQCLGGHDAGWSRSEGLMMDMTRIAATLLAVGIVLAGCGGGGGEEGATSSTSTELPGTEPAPTAAASAPPGEEAGLDGQTLRLEDLPGSWNPTPESAGGVGALACLHFLEAPPVQERVVREATQSFARGSGMPMFNQVVLQFETADDAVEVMDSLEGQVEACSTLGVPGQAPSPGPVRPSGEGFQPLTVPAIEAADRVSAWEMSAQAGAGIPLMATVIILQRGEFLSTLLSVNMGADESGYLSDMAAVAVERLA